MPIAAIAAIASLAAAGIGVGTTLYEAENQPSQPKISTTATPLTSSQNSAQAASVGQQLPTLQSLTGGSVSPEYAAQYGSTQAGVANDPQAPGNIQSAINQFFGLSAPGSTGLTATSGTATPGGAGILDLLSKAKLPGTGGGGSGDLVNSILSGDDFKGLAG